MILLIAGVSGLGCRDGGAEHAALVQRLDQLERRLDAVETAQAKTASAPTPAPVPIVLAPEIAPPSLGDTSTRDPMLHVDIGKGGITIDGVVVADDAIDRVLRSHAARSNLSGVIVSADDDVAYDDVITLMDRLRTNGLDRVAIAARGGARPPE